ncbi:cytidine deaminase-like [Melanaphis sacchari]|uniref:Cytidine deaminase n=1 Tax=Melanaphis sacchari TaxID=742174 RepID=A0A2H8U113_9HEMI|nr:cytidine deaminase-like [Melanaphis sacchari]XP_025199765.1 cytidine deaminase-like [Melanaphis sacchari]XP_025199766.1 cytidine deaminase-like [Melanaphis sacchari]XP_025199767.1 cytidine deaminase-like [Melanaphis sacchari]XP_025199768.1 cytidine deaminase-like [Melanaphis sacchari]
MESASAENTNRLKPLNELTSEDQLLISMCALARERAYVPYSNFKVGAALRCDDGTIFSGCNVENASYGLSICAERTVIVKAVSEGKTKFTKIAIAGLNKNQFVPPCGACRQVLSEFNNPNNDMIVYLYQPNGTNVVVTSVSELLPLNFKFDI